LVKTLIFGSMGQEALYNNTSGKGNAAIGNQSMYSNTTGHSNTAMGYQTLKNNTTGYGNTAFGYGTFFSGTTYTNSSAFGYGAGVSANNNVRIGSSTVSSIGGYANWSNVSDARMKINVRENVPGLNFITRLRPVTYSLDMDAIAAIIHLPDSLRLKASEELKAAEIQTGFIAQEVEIVAKEIGYQFSGVDAPKNENDHYGLRYAEFVVPLAKSVQEQQVMIEEQKGAIVSQQRSNELELAELRSMIVVLQQEIEILKKQ
jgi:trimeric autotransporter adhesin